MNYLQYDDTTLDQSYSPLVSLGMTWHDWLHQCSNNLKFYFSLVTISIKKSRRYCFLHETLTNKESRNLIGLDHILVFNLKLCVLY